MKKLLAITLLVLVSACSHLDNSGNRQVVYFGFGQSVLTESAKAIIDKVALEAKRGSSMRGAPWKHDNCHTKLANPCHGTSSTVKLVGHTDTVGNDSLNMVLSERRISSVKQRLVQQGVAIHSINTKAKGEKRPAVQTDDNVKEEKNRRVEIYIY